MKFLLYVIGAVAAVSLLYRLLQARAATPDPRDRRTKPIGGDAGHYGPSWLFGGDSPPHGHSPHGGSSHDPGDAGSSHHFGTDHGAGADTGFDSGGGGDGGGSGGGGD